MIGWVCFNCSIILEVLDCLALNVAFTKDFIVGSIQIVVFFTILLFATLLSTWYYGLLITLGAIAALYGGICIVDIFIKLIKKIFKIM